MILVFVDDVARETDETAAPPEHDRFAELGHGPDGRYSSLFENGTYVTRKSISSSERVTSACNRLTLALGGTLFAKVLKP